MLSKLKVHHIVLVLLLIVTALLTIGCLGVRPPPYVWYERPAITTDGAGGIIVFHAILEPGILRREFRRQFYLQRVDKEGNFLWGDEGVLVGKGYTRGPCAFEIVSDGSGGAIVVWEATFKRGTAEETHAIHGARVGPRGEILWQREFRSAREVGRLSMMRLVVMSDGSREVIIGTCCLRYGLIAQRIDSEGQFLWGEIGITLSQEPSVNEWVGDYDRTFDGVISKEGAAIFVWEQEDGTILAQKISPEGESLWPAGGVPVDVSEHSGPQVISDGSGGAIIAWIRGFRTIGMEVRAQRIDAQGNPLWQQGGIPICAGKKRGVRSPDFYMTGSGTGKAIITYQARLGHNLQRVDSEGNLQWEDGGVLVPTIRTPNLSMVGDNYGGAILVFPYRGKLEAQKVDAEGKLLWLQRGMPVTTIPAGPFSIVAESEGGVFVAWVVSEVSPLRSYIQRINAEGERMWGDEGILLNP